MRVFLISIIAFLSLSFPVFYFLNNHTDLGGDVAGLKAQSASVTVMATVGKYHFTLFGYTSPDALVSLDGMTIHDQTTANSEGYFEFTNLYSPLTTIEACLIAQDQLGRLTSPVCLPPFPIDYDTNIGPVLMSPTVSLNKNSYFSGDEVILSGQTIPNTDVDFSTFIDEKKSVLDYLFPSVYGYTFPQLNTQSDAAGNFSLSLPSYHTQYFRLFAQTSYLGSISPESIRLNLNILPIWITIFTFLKSRLLEMFLLTELAVMSIFFLRRFLFPHIIARDRMLALRPISPLLKEETTIILQRERPI